MEVIMSSPVQECLRTENDNGNGAARLTKSQRKNRRRKAWKQKKKENLGLLEKREDTEIPKSKPEAQFYAVSPASLQGDLTNGIGTSATVDKNMAILSPAATGDEKSLKLKGKEGEMGSSMTTNLNGEVKVQKNIETTIGETSLGTSATNNTSSKKRKRKRKKMNNNPDMGDILSTHESTQGLSMTKVLGVESNGTGLGIIATPDANMVSNGDHTEVVGGKIGESETQNLNVNGMDKKKKKLESKNKQLTLGEILNPQYLQNLEAAKGATGSGATSTDKPASKKQKRQKLNTNPDLGDILSTHESTQEGLSTTKVLEVKSGETVSVTTATSDANMVLKEDHTVAVNGKMQENGTSNLIVNGKGKKKKKRKPKNKRPTLGESLNPQSIENLEAAKHETGSNTIATDNLASEMQMRQQLNTNPDLDDILSTHESKQEGSSTTKVVEVKNGEMVSGKTATSDANMVFEKDLTEVAKGKMVQSETTNLNDNDNNVKKKNMLQSKNKRPTLGEILNPQYFQSLKASEGETGSGTTSKDNPASKEQKSQRLNKNPDLGDILSTRESKQEGSSTINAHEIKSGETVLGKTAILDANDVLEGEDLTVAVNGKMQENGTNNLNVNGKGKKKKRRRSKNKEQSLGENLNPQYIQNFEADLKSAETADLEIAEADASKALSMKRQKMGVKEITQVATVGKKLLILDVNGLLADVVSHRPTDIKADKYITRRSIFKRPYLDDFLCFCFERFIVGIWSSRAMRNLNPVVDFLLGDLKKKLLFLWDGSQCINSGIKTLEDKYKCLVVKDLRKIWDKDGPGNSWVKGTFHESNTLLVDDSPYKALLNPKYTGIFPASYSYKDREDNFLGPKGDLRTYLEGLAAADNVKTYVEQHPFGQDAIDEKNPHWDFYSHVLGCLNGSEPLT